LTNPKYECDIIFEIEVLFGTVRLAIQIQRIDQSLKRWIINSKRKGQFEASVTALIKAKNARCHFR
jgi:hypothetical protein